MAADKPFGVDLQVRALTHSARDRKILDKSYKKIYVPGFPDPDERESRKYFRDSVREDMKRGPGGERFHYIVAELNREVVGIRVMNYQAHSNTGMVQFWVVRDDLCGRGIGRQMDELGELLLTQDAQAVSKSQGKFNARYEFTGAEANNPYTYPREPKIDGMKRLQEIYKNKWLVLGGSLRATAPVEAPETGDRSENADQVYNPVTTRNCEERTRTRAHRGLLPVRDGNQRPRPMQGIPGSVVAPQNGPASALPDDRCLYRTIERGTNRQTIRCLAELVHAALSASPACGHCHRACSETVGSQSERAGQ
jgi:hypothetical protein